MTTLPMFPEEPAHPDARTDLKGWAEYAKEKIDGRPVIVSVSGGKDSLAVGLLLKSAGIPFTCVHMDTGWEHELTEKYVREYLPTVLGPIKILQGRDGGMEGLVKRKGRFATRRARFCTEELKLIPFRDYLLSLDDEPVNAVGVRAQESKARSRLPEWEDSKGLDCETWRPILDWSYQDVIDLHRQAGAEPNPLYLKGAERVGCWPCLFSRKAEIRMVADTDPARIDRLERLESDVTEMAVARYAAKGTTIEELGYRNPAFFQDTNRDTNGQRLCKPIREVVKWSRTKWGGKTSDPNDVDYGREGCLRWGFCDTGGGA